MYIGMTLFMPLTMTVKWSDTDRYDRCSEADRMEQMKGVSIFGRSVMAGLATLILSFCGSLLEWKNQPDGS